jgi:hypothetical protein
MAWPELAYMQMQVRLSLAVGADYSPPSDSVFAKNACNSPSICPTHLTSPLGIWPRWDFPEIQNTNYSLDIHISTDVHFQVRCSPGST